ncbi:MULTISPECIES: ligase-associated DNA damage response endonuclease PdeM [unclassified Xanthobacter]|uniref:ligase-associated DNA damage response endonuclease PdeM n=1 Tax=unclassified Xanthobacter TaxID=2623496 RepID=UPI001F465EB3|nr:MULTISPECIES: ligase-associated DNA damage response endonuclease PdeM [unclassified Xanthobacter]
MHACADSAALLLTSIGIAGAELLLDPSGAAFWVEERLLVVADMHLEKGSAFARRGQMLPPFDTRDTLDRLERLVARHQPRTLLALGDSLHDRWAAERLDDDARMRIRALAAKVDLVWIAGNHDPAPHDLGGTCIETLALGPLRFRHEPEAESCNEPEAERCNEPEAEKCHEPEAGERNKPDAEKRDQPEAGECNLSQTGAFYVPPAETCGASEAGRMILPHAASDQPDMMTGEVCGHLHPAARVVVRGRSLRRRCFVSDGTRLILPAFGAFTGGLDVTAPAIAGLFARGRFEVHLLGDGRTFRLPAPRLGVA